MERLKISQCIRAYRERMSLTQEAFGALIGVSAQAVSKWEREVCYPDITLLPFLANAVGCSVNDFFDSAPERNTEN